MSTRWTKGPWSVSYTERGGGRNEGIRISAEDGYVASVLSYSHRRLDQKRADARLIAAAPALAEALERIDHTLSVHGHVDADTELHGFVRAALASAKGEQ